MATQTLKQIRLWKPTISEQKLRGGPDDPYFKEAASQTWKKGSLVYGDTSGNIAICTESSGAMTSQVMGQALQAGRNLASAAAGSMTAGDRFSVHIIKPTDIFVANVYHATPGSAVTAQTDKHDRKGLILVSGLWHVDYANAVEGTGNAEAKVEIVGFPDKVDGVPNAIGDTYGFVLVRFLVLSASITGTVAVKSVLQGG